MSIPDPTGRDVETTLADLGARTASIGAPPGLESRVMARLRVAAGDVAARPVAGRRPDSFWDVEWWMSLRAVPIAAGAAALAVALAFWQDGLLTDSLVRSVKAPTDVEIRDP